MHLAAIRLCRGCAHAASRLEAAPYASCILTGAETETGAEAVMCLVHCNLQFVIEADAETAVEAD